MAQNLTIPEVTTSGTQKPPVGFHFTVVFFMDGILPNPLDMRFKRVAGLSAEIETVSYNEGGENLFTHRLPNRVSYNNLVLERGIVVGPPSVWSLMRPCPRCSFTPVMSWSRS